MKVYTGWVGYDALSPEVRVNVPGVTKDDNLLKSALSLH